MHAITAYDPVFRFQHPIHSSYAHTVPHQTLSPSKHHLLFPGPHLLRVRATRGLQSISAKARETSYFCLTVPSYLSTLSLFPARSRTVALRQTVLLFIFYILYKPVGIVEALKQWNI